MDSSFLIRVGIALALLALVFVLIARRARRVREATLGRSTLRRRVSTLPSGYRRIEKRLDSLGFRTLGDFDLCDEAGTRVHRMFISWNDGTSTLSLRGMRVAGFFTELRGAEATPASIVVQTSMFDVDWTPPGFVVQTARGTKHGSERSLVALHEEAVVLLDQEGWGERVGHGDPLDFARTVLVELESARKVGTRRTGISIGRAVRRTYATGDAQIGSGIRGAGPTDPGDGTGAADPEIEIRHSRRSRSDG